MGKEEKTFKPRQQHNNANPHNKLELNKFHQIQAPPKPVHNLHKQKRDLERMIAYRQKKGQLVEQLKVEELKTVEDQLVHRKKGFQQQQRKQFFLSSQYKQVMNIERRKVARKLRQIKAEDANNQELLTQWIKKLNYIKHFPQNLKYVSLFPSSTLSERAKAFQLKVMEDIHLDLTQKKEKLNRFQVEYKDKTEGKACKRDDFFLEEQLPQED